MKYFETVKTEESAHNCTSAASSAFSDTRCVLSNYVNHVDQRKAKEM